MKINSPEALEKKNKIKFKKRSDVSRMYLIYLLERIIRWKYAQYTSKYMYELKTTIKDTSRCLTKYREPIPLVFFSCLCYFNFFIPLTMQACASVLSLAYLCISLFLKKIQLHYSNTFLMPQHLCRANLVIKPSIISVMDLSKDALMSVRTMSNAVVRLARHNQLCIVCQVLGFTLKASVLQVRQTAVN